MTLLPNRHAPDDNWIAQVCTGMVYFYLSSLIVVLGTVLGHEYLKSPRPKQGDLLDAFANWDGQWYREIAESGYSYDSRANSNVAFFPAYPLLGRSVSLATGLPTQHALLLVSHVCLAAAFVVMAAYVRVRLGAASNQVGPFVLLAIALWPTTFFFRMAYSESLFLMTSLMAMYGMERNWPNWLLALIVGLATATRPVGVALLMPFIGHLWATSSTFGRSLLKCLVLVPLACWGLLGYVLFQWLAFDEPLGFIRTQAHWRIRPAVSLGEHTWSLATLEPIWSVYVPSSPCYWGRLATDANPIFSMQFANPIYFAGACMLVVLGWVKGWLNRSEAALAAGLLLIPYVTRSHEMCMGSMGRFSSVVFPVYLVLGQILARLSQSTAVLALALSGFWMGVYAALFAAWHLLF
jgi:hypothetical protein